MNERYSRQILFPPIGSAGQSKLGSSSVCIVGMGALGTVLANHMVRAGVGFVRIVDRDYVEASNLQRQLLYDENDVEQGLPKAVAAQNKLGRINSEVEIEALVMDVTPSTIEGLLDNVDLVLDGTDNFQTRYLLNDACFRQGIPFIYGGAVSARGMCAVLVPGATPCFRCLVPAAEADGQTCDMIGVISPIVDIIASFQAVEALKLLVGAEEARRDSLLSVDLWGNRLYEMKLGAPRKDCPCCQLKQYPALQARGDEAVALCGRETVQFASKGPMKLADWEHRLSPVAASLTLNPYLLRVELPDGERLVLFPDGRVLVQGTDDLTRAKIIYDRYIGS
ncbi:ThiF family adenylyltransferase [Paenibacillus sp. HB172176]|uniref:ThiF family adenylyltransferase n=1 Tax=Paenibacillus sp. HB172176 TaxID=2493690 RepID=UPI00143C8E3F|nr:ThiF family adenylyltransferase [Paenibacillus sp. HB172176]